MPRKSLACAVLVFWLAAVPAAAQEAATFVGSTTLLPWVQRAAEEYMRVHPWVRITVSGRGSGEGLRALWDGLAEMAGTSRDLTPAEEALARRRGIRVVKHLVAMDGVVPVVHPSNPVTGVSLADLAKVYLGEIRSWERLGGRRADITVLSREMGSGTFGFFREMVLKGGRIRPDALLLPSNGAMYQEMARNPRALGYLALDYLGPQVKPLRVDGVSFSLQAVAQGRWPLTRPLYLATRSDAPPLVQRLVEFLLGPRGQALAVESGLLPAPTQGGRPLRPDPPQ